MKVALFIPCYIDQFYPRVGVATLQLLEKLGCSPEYPRQQTCCGQPMANAGNEQAALPVYRHFADTFGGYDYVVAPSGSCVHHVQEHYQLLEQTETVQHLRQRTLDLSAFLLDVLQVDKLNARFPHRVGLHLSCHGLRGLRLAQSSERVEAPFNKQLALLQLVDGIEIVPLDRPDECCGFGGTFSVTEEAVSAKMGRDRVADHLRHGADVITGGDMSCLMHLDGIIRRQGLPIRVMHLAEILNAG